MVSRLLSTLWITLAVPPQTGVNVERRWSAAVSTLASGWWPSLMDTMSYCSVEVWLGPRTTTEAALGTSGWPGCRISNASPHLRFPLHPGWRLPHLWVLLSRAWWSQSSTPEFRSWDSTCCLQRALASPGWVSLADWHPLHLHFWQRAHELLPREAHSMPSISPAFLSCSADLPGDISQRHLFFFTYRGVWAPWITLTGLSSIPLLLLSKTSLLILSSRSERKTG